MKYTTIIKAVDPKDGKIKTWGGPYIEAVSFEDARNYCQNNGLGYCIVVGQLIAEIPCDDNGKPNFKEKMDFDVINLN